MFSTCIYYDGYTYTYLGGGASSPVRLAKLSSAGGEVGGEGGKGGVSPPVRLSLAKLSTAASPSGDDASGW